MNYVDGGKNALRSQMYEHYDCAYSRYSKYLRQEQIDRKALISADCYDSMQRSLYKKQKFHFPILHAQHQMLVGQQRENRKNLSVTPIQNGSDQTATDMTDVISWADQYDMMSQTESRCYYHATGVGLCFGELYMDESSDPFGGDLRLKCHPPATIIFDPWWEKMDLSDCSFIWSRDYLPRETIKGILPGREKDIDRLKTPINSQSMRFNFMPESYQFKAKAETNINLDRYYYLGSREATMVQNKGTGIVAEFDGTADEADGYFYIYADEEERQNITIKRITKPTVFEVVMVGDQIMYEGQYADYYPFIPYVGYMDTEAKDYGDRFQGITRKGRDCQFLLNRRLEIQFDTLESLPTSGLNVVEDAFIDPMDAFKTGAGQVRVIKKGYTPEQAVSDIQPPRIDASAFKQTDDLLPLTHIATGITEEMMGMATENETGILEMIRLGAGQLSTRTLTDNLESSMICRGRTMISMIQEFFPVEKITRILGREPSEEFRDKLFGKYDCVIEESNNTATQRQKAFSQAIYLKQMGVNIPDTSLVRLATIHGKDEIIAEMDQERQAAAQAAEMQQKMEQLVLAQESNVKSGQAAAYYGLAEERVSRVGENEALAYEKKEEAEKSNVEALFKLAETLRVIQEMDITNLGNLLNIAQQLKQAEETSHESDIRQQNQRQDERRIVSQPQAEL
jgi:hypothetical protein